MKKYSLTVLFIILLLVLFTVPALATVPVTIGGSLFTEVRYTPENLWRGGSALAFWSNLETDQARVNLNLVWSDSFGGGDFIWFHSNDKPELPFAINEVTVTVDAPLFNSDKSRARVIMGDLGIDYSQWIGTLTRDHWRNNNLDNGANHSRGIAVENLKVDPGVDYIDPITLGAFHAWFNENEVFYGVYADTMIDNFGTTLAAMRYNNRPITLKDDGKSEYGESNEYENGVELLISGPVIDDIFMDLTTVYWERNADKNELSALLIVQLDYYNDIIGEVFFEVYSMGSDFAPRFYKHDYDDNATNEVESYLERVGSGVKASVTLSNDLVDVVDLSVGTDLYNKAKDNIPGIYYNETWVRADKNYMNNEIAAKVAVRSVTDGKAIHKYHDYNDILLYGRLLSPLVRESKYDVNGRVLTKFSDAEDALILDGNLEAKLNDGLFKGLAAYVGIQKNLQDSEDEVKPYLGLNYRTPGDIEIGVRYAADDVVSLGFDEIGDTADKEETYISIKKTVEF